MSRRHGGLGPDIAAAGLKGASGSAANQRRGITIVARIRLLPTDEGGRYRPNHNFFGPDDRTMTVGFIDLPEGTVLMPGEAIELTMTFWDWPGLAAQVHPGREWRIQEGARLVGFGTVLEVLMPPAAPPG